jgi:hypothetical protein
VAGADDIYDDDTWALIQRWHAERVRVPVEVARGWRAGVGATALFTAAALGVQDVLEPERRTPVIEEVDLDSLGRDDVLVRYFHVPGAPRASRAVVRPWLA